MVLATIPPPFPPCPYVIGSVFLELVLNPFCCYSMTTLAHITFFPPFAARVLLSFFQSVTPGCHPSIGSDLKAFWFLRLFFLQPFPHADKALYQFPPSKDFFPPYFVVDNVHPSCFSIPPLPFLLVEPNNQFDDAKSFSTLILSTKLSRIVVYISLLLETSPPLSGVAITHGYVNAFRVGLFSISPLFHYRLFFWLVTIFCFFFWFLFFWVCFFLFFCFFFFFSFFYFFFFFFVFFFYSGFFFFRLCVFFVSLSSVKDSSFSSLLLPCVFFLLSIE